MYYVAGTTSRKMNQVPSLCLLLSPAQLAQFFGEFGGTSAQAVPTAYLQQDDWPRAPQMPLGPSLQASASLFKTSTAGPSPHTWHCLAEEDYNTIP